MARVSTTLHGKLSNTPNLCPHGVTCLIRTEKASELPRMPNDSMQLRSSVVFWKPFGQPVIALCPGRSIPGAQGIGLHQIAYMCA